MRTALYLIETITNLHVGSGEISYGLVDNLIQRDVLSNLPVINASGVKGGLLEFMRSQNMNSDTIRHIFGGSPEPAQKNESAASQQSGQTPKSGDAGPQPGKWRFFDASLLALPVRSDKTPYFLVTCPQVLEELRFKMLQLGCEKTELCDKLALIIAGNKNIGDDKAVKLSIETPVLLEDLEITLSVCPSQCLLTEELFGKAPVLLISNKNFNKFCNDEHLPIIARNNLNNGISQNLWYEQVLPRCSRMAFFVMHDEAENPITEFDEKLGSASCQFGANASIGYGFCKVSKL